MVGTLPRHQGQALSILDFRKQGSHTSFTSAAPSSFERKPSLDTDISSPGSIKKKLSFGESGNDEAVTSAAKDSATASQEPKASAEEQPATAASDEPKASAKKPSANTSAPGSLTVVGHSTDERFRITYEARQLISGLDGSGSKPEGHVGKGLLVVPGTWARLSNISDDGRWIKHEEFQVGSKTFVHGQGRSVGRILESWRQLRKDRPELFERIEVMSQPAANVDSLILSWVIESQAEQYPASLWQRDCFASVFSTTATEAMHLANQISTLVAAKCTSKLQITDSDFSKQFKSLVKGKLQQLRPDFQQKYQQDAAWKVGSLEILESVVFAQEEMSKKNLEDEWVLEAAIRNGILGYIPSGGKLQKVTECSWAQAEGFQMGTKRTPSDWFKDRFSWLSPDGKPIEPDWSLSDSASEIADLQRWDYYSKEDEQNDSADEGQHLELVEIEGELEEQLELSLENSLNLRLHPSLRRALHKRLADPSLEEQLKKKKEKKVQRRHRLKLRQLARDELRKVTQQKLQNHSRREVLETLRKEVKGQAKAKAKAKAKLKLSAMVKTSKTHKASAKSKPSVLAKSKKKSASKTSKIAEKIADVKKAEKAEKAKKPALEEPPPLEEQVEEQAEEQVDSARGFLRKEVIVTSEAAGKLAFGIDGTAQLYCLPEDGLGEVDLLAGVHKDTVLLEDQHIQMGWSLLSWALQKSGAAIPSDQFGIVDSALTRNIALQVHVEHKQFLIQKLKNHLERHSVLCVPIFSENPSHWTLLVVDQRFSPAQLRWYDSLQHQSQDAIQAATLVAEWLQLAGFEPLRVNSAFQDNSDCGWWVLNYLELEARKLRGETITLWPASRAQYWKGHLIQISASLGKELSKVQTQLENDIKKRQDKEKKAQAAKAAAEEKLSSMKNKESAAAAKAKELIETNSLRVTRKDLTLEEKHQIKSLQGAPEVCSRCRWQSGCQSCSAFKALRYLVQRKAHLEHKLAFVGGQVQFTVLFLSCSVIEHLVAHIGLPGGQQDVEQLFKSM